MAADTRPPTPDDDGVRPARFGLKTLIAAVVLAVVTTVFALKIFGGGGDKVEPQAQPAMPPPPVTRPETVAPPVEPVVEVPAPPSIHPLEGRRRILSAPPGNWRNASLSWTNGLVEEGYPLATVERGDPCVWELVGEEGRKDVYRILCRTGAGVDGHALTYTRFKKSDHPNATVESGDPCLWKVTEVKTKPGLYKIVCYDDSDWHAGELSWDMAHDFDAGHPIATVEKNDPTAWRIIAEDAPLPAAAAAVTHVVIFPKAKLGEKASEKLNEWAPKIVEHIAEKGDATLKLTIELHDGNEIVSHYAGTKFQDAAAQLRKAGDPVAEFLPGSLSIGRGGAIGALVEDAAGDGRKLEPFPLVLPVLASGTLAVESISSLLFEDDAFRYSDKLEKIEGFQSYLDDSENASGRVFHGADYFTYVFVNLTPAAP